MSSCKLCGEAGHFAGRCHELHMPSYELYTGPGSEGGGEEEDHLNVVYEKMPHEQSGLMDDELQSKLTMLVYFLYTFPNILSNVEV